MAVGATGDTALAYEQGRVTAIEGRALGIHIAYAPVLDVNNNPTNPVINTRSYGEDPKMVARLGAAFIRGVQEHGMVATGKHFPGHGDTGVNSHLALPVVPASRARLDTVELVPFRAAVRAGVPLVMVGHAVYPALDPDHIASQSRAIATGLLRTRLRFSGVSVTDSLEAAAARATGHVDEAAEASLRAGVDLMLTTGRGSAARVYRRLLADAQRDPALRARVRESATRVERLRAGLARPAGG
jgi:beta-N-acetylhexosaminidase